MNKIFIFQISNKITSLFLYSCDKREINRISESNKRKI